MLAAAGVDYSAALFNQLGPEFVSRLMVKTGATQLLKETRQPNPFAAGAVLALHAARVRGLTRAS
jgi:hypothetical protein